MDRLFPKQDWTPPQPASDDQLWRYIDFTQFVSILENEALWFSQASAFFDPFEGALPREKLQELAEQVPNEIDDPVKLVSRFYDALRQTTYVNCWHQRPGESASMWQLYQNKGKEVAIKTTVSRLDQALSIEHEVSSGLVEYVDYSRPDKFSVNRTAPFFYKRPSFRHEEEYRAVISNFKSPDGVPVDSDFVDRVAEDAAPGKEVSVSPEKLFEEVYVSPVAGGWMERLVGDVLVTYGLEDVPVIPSNLSKDPFE